MSQPTCHMPTRDNDVPGGVVCQGGFRCAGRNGPDLSGASWGTVECKGPHVRAVFSWVGALVCSGFVLVFGMSCSLRDPSSSEVQVYELQSGRRSLPDRGEGHSSSRSRGAPICLGSHFGAPRHNRSVESRELSCRSQARASLRALQRLQTDSHAFTMARIGPYVTRAESSWDRAEKFRERHLHVEALRCYREASSSCVDLLDDAYNRARFALASRDRAPPERGVMEDAETQQVDPAQRMAEAAQTYKELRLRLSESGFVDRESERTYRCLLTVLSEVEALCTAGEK